ncbi:hypothetical protein QUA86_14590 [Microcoleus sp. F6_B6]
MRARTAIRSIATIIKRVFLASLLPGLPKPTFRTSQVSQYEFSEFGEVELATASPITTCVYKK